MADEIENGEEQEETEEMTVSEKKTLLSHIGAESEFGIFDGNMRFDKMVI